MPRPSQRYRIHRNSPYMCGQRNDGICYGVGPSRRKRRNAPPRSLPTVDIPLYAPKAAQENALLRLVWAASLLILLLGYWARAITPAEMAQRVGKSWTKEQSLHQEMSKADSVAWQAPSPCWSLYGSLQGGASETNTASPSKADSWTANAGLVYHIRQPYTRDPYDLYRLQEQSRRNNALFQLRYADELLAQRKSLADLWYARALDQHWQRQTARLENLSSLLKVRSEAGLSTLSAAARVLNANADARLKRQDAQTKAATARLSLSYWLDADEEPVLYWNFLPCLPPPPREWTTHPLAKAKYSEPPLNKPFTKPWWDDLAIDARLWHTTQLNAPLPDPPEAGFGAGLFAQLPLGVKDQTGEHLRVQKEQEISLLQSERTANDASRAYAAIRLAEQAARQLLHEAKAALRAQYAITAGDSTRFLDAGLGDIETLLMVYQDLSYRELAVIESQRNLVQLQAEALYYADSKEYTCGETEVAGPAPMEPSTVPLAAYAWQGSRWLSHPDSLAQLASRLNLRKVAIGLGASDLAAGFPRLAWTRLVSELGARGIQAELLLGEPLWILPAYRPQLIALLESARKAGVSAVHLDEEPEQLKAIQPTIADSLPPYLLQTLAEARKAFPRPLELTASLHHRHFSDSSLQWEASRLDALGLDHIVLMAYVNTPQKQQALLSSALSRAPRTPLALAASLETHLPAINRLTIPPAKAGRSFIEPRPAFLYIQSMEDWMLYQEELP